MRCQTILNILLFILQSRRKINQVVIGLAIILVEQGKGTATPGRSFFALIFKRKKVKINEK